MGAVLPASRALASFTIREVPRREAPSWMNFSASSRLEMPPAALIFTWGATCPAKSSTSWKVAPAVEKPVEVLMYSAPESETTLHMAIFSSSVSRQVSRIPFTAAAPAAEDPSLEALEALFRDDLDSGYPGLSAAATAQGDRGTQRICVWGEKVTQMLYALLGRYQREGEAFLRGTQVWVCSVCGFVYIGDTPPELCPVCKVPAWKFDKIEGRRPA